MTINLLTGLDYANAEAVKTAAANMGTLNDKKVIHQFASLAFSFGRAAKDRQVNELPDFGPAVDAFFAAHYNEATGRKLSDKSRPVYKSGALSFAEAGFHGKYDAAACATFAAEYSGSGNLGERGTTLRKILAAFPETCPTTADMDTFKPKKKAATASTATDDLVDAAEAAFGDKGDHIAALTTPALRLARLDMMTYIAAFRAALPRDPEAVTTGTNYKAAAAALRKEIKEAAAAK